ncbi:MAG: ABC transporter ATP-binding protein [Euryarchaeota archaeon]|nr:ABC transporter ATP-binding protein [Euryarchaeota archaeon]MDE1836210.1 ABC transporter ATP-binding protein [Euryarchaeota archaeon]MDE1881193.1 ABC transporter ATP-binding protein [Euryarchaeota archaeon]MDE2045029.1 ABC transporter ATP-binding protein [Thermoplasmata archaeon]
MAAVVGSEVVLRTEDLGFSYTPGHYAVRHLDLEMHRGEVLGLLGRNGAGKTTTVRLLTTLIPPTEGTAYVLGEDLRKAGRALRSRMGVVLQSDSLDFVTVERNLVLYAFLWGVPRETAKARAEEMLELFELGHVRRRKPWAISGGERRRFQVARELMHDMDLLFLDEPTVGLDAVARRRILRYLKERARGGLSIVFTTHILHEADALCDRIAVLHQGQLLAVDTADALKRRYGGSRELRVTFAQALPLALGRSFEEGLKEKGADPLPTHDPPTAEKSVFAFRSPRPEELLPWIVQWGVAQSHEIEELSLTEPTLEGAFLGMVGADEEGESEGPPGSAAPPSARPGGFGWGRK